MSDLLQRVGHMLVTTAQPDYFEVPGRALVNLKDYDGTTLKNRYRNRHSKYGTVPFDAAGDRLRLYPGGVTIWSGFPGAGKTTLLRQFVCHCLARGSSAFMASLEEDPENVVVELAAVASGCEEPSAHQIQWFLDAYQERFRLWGVIGMAKHQELLAVIRELAAFSVVKHAVIDSLMCLDVANDDFEAQRNFANLVAATARACRIHIHLVAHPRKLLSADQDLDINDVAGARELGGIADNVIFIRRAKTEAVGSDTTPMIVSVRKQRHGGGATGTMEGWYHRKLRQFHVQQFPQGATRYLPDDAYA